jgi:cyclopropane fatty-acyl-phospholipid synthase-like methyltransferase
MSTATFDAVAYKTTTREQWQTAAEPCYRWGKSIEDWLGEATETTLDIAGVGPGSRVLDVAASAGGQTLAAARRARPAGRVLATDIPGTFEIERELSQFVTSAGFEGPCELILAAGTRS